MNRSSWIHVIDGIVQIKKMKSQKRFKPEKPIIVVSSDMFVIIASEDRHLKPDEILHLKKYLDIIRFSDIGDIKFPDLSKVKEKIDMTQGIPFKIVTPHEDYCIYVLENMFLQIRDLFKDITVKKEEV